MKITLKRLLLLSLIPVLMAGCKFKPGDPLEWDADLLIPLAHSTVNLFDAVSDTSDFQVGNDNSVSIILRDTILNTGVTDFFAIPDTTIEQVLRLDSLRLDSDTIVQEITLAFLAHQLKAQGNPAGDLILLNQGQEIFLLPTNGLSSGIVDVDASAFFDYAELQEGTLQLTILNKLKMDLKNVSFEVRNKNIGGIIAADTFPSINNNQSVNRFYDLADKTVESALEGEMTNIDIPGGFFEVDTNAFIRITLAATGLKAYNATAIFPSQTVLDTTEKLEYEFPPEYADVEILKIIVREGGIRVEAVSTIEDTITFGYSLLSATNQGMPATITRKMNPAPPGGNIVQIEDVPLKDFVLDMTNPPLGYNTLIQSYNVGLVYSGNIVNIDLEDSVYMFFGLLDIVPSYVEGYIGQQVENFTGEENLDVFTELNIGNMDLLQPKVELTFVNSIGVNARAQLHKLTGYNSKTGGTVTISSASLSSPLIINGPVLPDTFGRVYTTLLLDYNNSNIRDFINLQPDKVSYDVTLEANYDGMPGVRNNFATWGSGIQAFFDFELPLYGSLENLQIIDTVGLSFAQSTQSEFDNVLSGTLKLLLENEFPFQARVNAVIYDDAWVPVATLFTDGLIAAGILNTNGIVDQPAKSMLEMHFEKEELDRILASGKHLVLRYRIDTQPANTPVRVYSNYEIDAKLVGDFRYGIKP